MADFTIKQGDRLPEIYATLADADGAPVDLTGASVRLHLASVSTGALTLDAAASVLNPPTAGGVRYSWQDADTAADDDLRGEFQVTFSDGRVETFPNDDYFSVSVVADLA